MASEPSSKTLKQRRKAPGESTDNTSATGIISHAAKEVESKVEQALLHLWDDLEPWRRDNAFIRGGYRPTSYSYRRSLASLGYLHNESVNIWSHLLGAVGFSLCGILMCTSVTPRYSSASMLDILVFASFFGGAFLCLGMSATYHALSNHSADVAKWGNKLDYSGIVLLIVGSYYPALYYGFSCLPKLMTFYLFMISLLGVGCLVMSTFEHFRTPEWRPYRTLMFVALGLSGVIPVLHAVTIYGLGDLHKRMGLGWILLQGGLYILGAFLYAFRWPERQSPGHFDIWGSSHQIFHVFVLLAAAAHLYGMCRAFDFHHSAAGGQCET